MLEIHKKDLEISIKKLGLIQNDYKSSVAALEKLQMEKQVQLNQVRCAVVLNLDQMEYIEFDNGSNSNISDVLIFSKSSLSNLYKRVSVLQQETALQKSIHEY